ncbi:hypothetical protein AKO1_008799 [Acrasis kona]|uniref:Uncharacterized protein n=1 Tax=Acrasis kona TaxID=1008807 RepID=A0AAW2ZG87_9EUKA
MSERVFSPAEDRQNKQEEGIDLNDLSSPHFYKNGGLPYKNINLTMNIPPSINKKDAIHQPPPMFLMHPKRHIPLVNSPNNQTPTKFTSPNLYLAVQKSARHAMMSPVMLTPNDVSNERVNYPSAVTTLASQRPTPIIIPKRPNGDVQQICVTPSDEEQQITRMQRLNENLDNVTRYIKQTGAYSRFTSISLSNARRSFNMFTIVLCMLAGSIIAYLSKYRRFTDAQVALVVVSALYFTLNLLSQLYRSTFLMSCFILSNLGAIGYILYDFIKVTMVNQRFDSFVDGLGTVHVGFVLLFLSLCYSIAYTVTYYQEHSYKPLVNENVELCTEVLTGSTTPISPDVSSEATGPGTATSITSTSSKIKNIPSIKIQKREQNLISQAVSPYIVINPDS